MWFSDTYHCSEWKLISQVLYNFIKQSACMSYNKTCENVWETICCMFGIDAFTNRSGEQKMAINQIWIRDFSGDS